MLITSIQLEVHPHLIDDLTQLMSYLEGQMLIPMLRKYRPPMRPYTQELES